MKPKGIIDLYIQNLETMKKFTSAAIYILLLCGLLFSGCDNEFTDHQERSSLLQVKASVQNESTRTVVRETYLPRGSTMGVFLFDKDGGRYDNQSYNNVKFTATGGGTTQTWDGVTDLLLSSTQGKATAYFPYDAAVTDIAKIPIDAGTDIDLNDWDGRVNISRFNPDNGGSVSRSRQRPGESGPYLEKAIYNFRESKDDFGKNDWYITAAAQLAVIAIYKEDINAALKAIGGNPLSETTYPSSTYQTRSSFWEIDLKTRTINTKRKETIIQNVRFTIDL